MNYEQAVLYLDSFVNYERQHDVQAMREVNLDRMRQLCQRLGDPQRRFRSILVTGTNGKGSICAMLYSILRESSLRVGLYTSPHLEHLRERIRVWTAGPGTEERSHGDDWMSEDALAQLMTQLQPVIEQMRQESLLRLPPLKAGVAQDSAPRASSKEPGAYPGGSTSAEPTYFEVLTALAFTHFSQQHVDVAVLEVGLGGRLDATNIVEQAVSVVAPIDVDHAEILGPDPATIAQEKAGIIKPNQVVITAPQQEPVLAVLRQACEANGVPLFCAGRDLTVGVQNHDLEGLQVSLTGLRGIYESLSIPLCGLHQAHNAMVAVGALEALSTTGIPYSIIEQGLARVEWPGRLEVVNDVPLVVMDGAHNPQAAAALQETLIELCPHRRIHFLVGVSTDKAVEPMAQCWANVAFGITCTRARHPRAMDPTELAKRLLPYCSNVHVMSDAADACTYLLNAVSSEDVIVITGSLFLVGELRAAFRRFQTSRRGRVPVAA